MPEIVTRIFIIDPDPDFLDWAAGHLKAAAVTVEKFAKAEDALAAYQKNRCDLLLSEVRLPGVNGIELLKRVRQIDPNAMVLLFSGIVSTSHVIDAMRLGAYDVLQKDKLNFDLRVVVESALRAVEG